jgi:hypothetical protein
MARSCYSLILDHPADAVWNVIRPFDHYAWAGVKSTTVIEEDKRGDQVGAIRRVTVGTPENPVIIRQQLLAHSDLERSYTYSLCEPAHLPVRNYIATIRLTPVAETRQTFAEWWATFDCAEEKLDHWTRYFAQDGFAVWLRALREFMRTARG